MPLPAQQANNKNRQATGNREKRRILLALSFLGQLLSIQASAIHHPFFEKFVERNCLNSNLLKRFFEVGGNDLFELSDGTFVFTDRLRIFGLGSVIGCKCRGILRCVATVFHDFINTISEWSSQFSIVIVRMAILARKRLECVLLFQNVLKNVVSRCRRYKAN